MGGGGFVVDVVWNERDLNVGFGILCSSGIGENFMEDVFSLFIFGMLWGWVLFLLCFYIFNVCGKFVYLVMCCYFFVFGVVNYEIL